MNFKGLGLKQQILLAAFELTGGDLNITFTAEELLVHGWKNDNQAWGLRGFEKLHPDSSKLFKELDAHAGKQGIVGEGLLEKVHRRVFRLTPTGLAEASALRPSDAIAREKVDRQLEQAVKQIIEHRVFKDWLLTLGPAGHCLRQIPFTASQWVQVLRAYQPLQFEPCHLGDGDF